MAQISNPGSALGEALGSLLEQEIHQLLRPIVEQLGAIYITSPQDISSAKTQKKLILTDQDGNDYEVDAVIVNRRFQSLVLLESKYIRYKKAQSRQSQLDLHGTHKIAGKVSHNPSFCCRSDGKLEPTIQTLIGQF